MSRLSSRCLRRASANQTLTIPCSSAVAPDQPAGKPIAIPVGSRLTASRRVLSLAIAQQPRIDNPPLVASPRLKIQQRRPRILQFEKEPQRVSAGWPARFNGMRLKPALPFPNDQRSCVFLSHQHAPRAPFEGSCGCAGLVGALFGSVTQKEIRAAAAPMNTFAPYCDRDDLIVCKRAQENGDRTNWKFEASLKYW